MDICVKLGDEVTAAIWSCNVVDATGSGFGGGAGADTGARGVSCVGADDDDAEALLCWLAEGVTAAAAAVAYFNGGRCTAGRPALSILDIGCCAKFGFGGGFGAVRRCMVRKICEEAERGKRGQTFACC